MIRSLHYSLHEVVGYINWSYFFHAWGFPARFAAIAQVHGCDSCRAQWLASFPEADRMRAAEAMQLHKEALRMLTFLDQQGHRVHFRFGLFDCNSEGEDIVIGRLGAAQCTLSFLRQQAPPFLCLADFIRPVNSAGEPDRIGVFCAAADEAIEHSYEGEDDYLHLLCQTLADRLAEAATERAHQAVRKHYWGYAVAEELTIPELQAECFQGIRPAVGYPSLPDQSLVFDLDRLIDFSSIGIHFTQNGAMQPHASTCGLMMAHPQARYFDVGRIGEDQLLDYARRKGRAPEELRTFLTKNLS